MTPHSWDPIPGGARCASRGDLHPSFISAQPILDSSNYVLVLERDYVAFGNRSHGLVELVFGEDSRVFPICLPRWLNWPLLQAFLGPISHRGHFGIQMMGFLNGDRLDQRLVLRNAGFFVHMCILEVNGLDGPLSLLLVDTL